MKLVVKNCITSLSKIIIPLLATPLWLAPPVSSLPHRPSQLVYSSGTQVSLNGRILPAAWRQWELGTVTGSVRTGIADAGIAQLLGVEFLNSNDARKQPVSWFLQPKAKPLVLNTLLAGPYRYLDITQLATLEGWQLQTNGNTLRITTPAAKVKAIRLGKQPWGMRIVVDLNRPTPWRVSEGGRAIAIDAAAADFDVKRFNSSPSSVLKLETAPNLTTIRFSLPPALSPRVSTLNNRLVIDIRPDPMVERDILWAPGLHYRQQFLELGTSRFPVVWLEIDPRDSGLVLKPIWSQANTLVGTETLLKTATRYAAAAAINGGFFNRNNKLPLGAIRRDGRWLSSPILNRGAIAWNDQGLVKIGRLRLQETIINSSGQRLPILALNSGYVKAGIARYSFEWGLTYTPLIDNEIIVVVQNNQVTAQLPGGSVGKTAFPIPLNGYLLTLRANSHAANSLPVGSIVRESSAIVPAYFAPYPQILGAGPILVQNRQIVLDAKAEGFSDVFIQEKAARSAIGTTAEGTLLIAAVHNRVNGAGPTLTEIAKVMQNLGCVDALNLDGGSSTSLYLGGQLLNRSPRTAARIHNGIGIFLEGRN